MTDKEIMQALNCCTSKSISCQKCPLLSKSKCERELIQYSFELINRQQAEIERLSKNQSDIDNFARDICRERMLKGKAISDFDDLQEYIRKESSESIKEFADMFDDELAKLRDTYFERGLKDYSLVCEVIHDYLYRTLREMVGAE